jgi:hypothetical protein
MSATKRIKIEFQKNGNGTLECVGLGSFPCQGLPTVHYPTDVTIHDGDKELLHHSIEFDVDMPYAIRIWPARGIYIHQWDFCRVEDGASAGCIHLCQASAKTVFDWVTDPTRITISYPW